VQESILPELIYASMAYMFLRLEFALTMDRFPLYALEVIGKETKLAGDAQHEKSMKKQI
jgi:hypothetical protein